MQRFYTLRTQYDVDVTKLVMILSIKQNHNYLKYYSSISLVDYNVPKKKNPDQHGTFTIGSHYSTPA